MIKLQKHLLKRMIIMLEIWVLIILGIAIVISTNSRANAIDYKSKPEIINIDTKNNIDKLKRNLEDSTNNTIQQYSAKIIEGRTDSNISIQDILEYSNNKTRIEINNAIDNETILFIGNSLIEGIRISTDTNNKFLCKVGISLNGLKDNIYDKISKSKFDLAIIGMGTNELGGYSKEAFIEGYNELISKIQSTNPDSSIVLLSIPPVSASKSSSGTRFNNKNVKIYNEYIQEIADQQDQIIYLDCTDFFGSELKSSWTGDGIHMSGSIYNDWYNFIINKLKTYNGG